MKVFSSVAVVALSAVLMSGCSSSPEDRIYRFFGYLEDGDVTQASRMVSSLSYAFWGKKIDNVLVRQAEKIKRCGGIEDLKIDEIKERSNDAVKSYRVEVKYGKDGRECGVDVDRLKLSKEEGQWYISFM